MALSWIAAGITYIGINNCKQKLYFRPPEFYDHNYESNDEFKYLVNDDDPLRAVYMPAASPSNRVCLVAHGNASSIHLSKNLLRQIRQIYPDDIICYEYPGFGDARTTTVEACVTEGEKWVRRLTKKYQTVDMWGKSIGGGIIARICANLGDKYNIEKIYLQSTFSCLHNVVYNMNPVLSLAYYLFTDELETYKRFYDGGFVRKEVIFLHSRNDDVVPFAEVDINVQHLMKAKGIQAMFIELVGDHNNWDYKK